MSPEATPAAVAPAASVATVPPAAPPAPPPTKLVAEMSFPEWQARVMAHLRGCYGITPPELAQLGSADWMAWYRDPLRPALSLGWVAATVMGKSLTGTFRPLEPAPLTHEERQDWFRATNNGYPKHGEPARVTIDRWRTEQTNPTAPRGVLNAACVVTGEATIPNIGPVPLPGESVVDMYDEMSQDAIRDSIQRHVLPAALVITPEQVATARANPLSGMSFFERVQGQMHRPEPETPPAVGSAQVPTGRAKSIPAPPVEPAPTPGVPTVLPVPKMTTEQDEAAAKAAKFRAFFAAQKRK